MHNISPRGEKIPTHDHAGLYRVWQYGKFVDHHCLIHSVNDEKHQKCF